MKKLTALAGAVLIAGIFSGCSTVDPVQLRQTDRDMKSYNETLHRSVPEGNYKVAIMSKVTPHVSAKVDKQNEEYKNDLYLAQQMESAITVNFTNLGKFDAVDRRHGMELSAESVLSGGAAVPASANFVLFADSSVTYVAKQGWKRTTHATKARGAQLATDCRLIDVQSKTVLFSGKYISTVDDTAKNGIREALERVANMNAKKFARAVAARFLPEVAVLQTRGNGEYAQIAMGKNFQATPAVKSWQWWPYKYLPLFYFRQTDIPATSIDFFYNQKVTGTGGKESIEPVMIGHGSVIRADKNHAWVEIDNYETANVLKGHNAKISEEVTDDQPLE